MHANEDSANASGPLPVPPSPDRTFRKFLRTPHLYFQQLQQHYGGLVRYRPAPDPGLLVSDPDYVRQVLLDDHRSFSKDTYINGLFKAVVADGLLTAEGDAWLRQRRLLQPAFHHRRLAVLADIMQEETERMLAQWDRSARGGEPIDAGQEMSALTLAITTRSLFGVGLGEEVRTIGATINANLQRLSKPGHPEFQRAVAEVKRITAEIIARRQGNPQSGGDLLAELLAAHDPLTGETLDDEQVRNQVITLLLAGYETTANALTWTLFLLASHPESIHNLRASGGNIREYALMAFYEAMRLYPPAWILGRRALEAVHLNGYEVPSGTVVAISPYVLHRHPAYWHHPEQFIPARFAGGHEHTQPHNYHYLPFGKGPRQCIGKDMALLEAEVILPAILARFQLALQGHEEIKPEAVYIMRPDQPVRIQLTPFGSPVF
jgi:cytochrome P450